MTMSIRRAEWVVLGQIKLQNGPDFMPTLKVWFCETIRVT